MLIDTNVLVEIGKKQEKFQDCNDFLDLIKLKHIKEQAYITSFAFHSLEALISAKNPDFLKEIVVLTYHDDIKIYHHTESDDLMTLNIMSDIGLDFDDAVQFVAANKLNTYLVTLDQDFKKTGLQIKSPGEVVAEIVA